MGLFKPAWMSNNIQKAIKAVGELTDQKELLEVTEKAQRDWVRIAAVKMLTDKATITDLALHSGHSDVRQAATETLSDPSVLMGIVKNDTEKYVRKAALENINLTDQSLLADVAKHDPDQYLRVAATIKLTNQSVLSDVARHDPERYVRKTALENENLNDQSVFEDVAKNDDDLILQKMAVEKISDKDVLAEIAEKSEKEDLRELAFALVEFPSSSEKLVSYYLKTLIYWYKRTPEGFVAISTEAEPVQNVGKKLDKIGGFDLMRAAHAAFAEQNPMMARNLEMCWHGIGMWQG